MDPADDPDMVKGSSPVGRGRPRKAAGEIAHPLAIRLTDEDREALRMLAKEQGLSLSTYIAAVLKRHIMEKP